ncbi:MAG: cfa 3, partial [Nocardioides sp.]|nr:cfa 3 [Nocardioides sp.]
MTTIRIADAIADLLRDGMPVRFTAYDGSATGPEDSPMRLELTNQRGLTDLLTAPGDLGLARAYVAGDLVVHGVHPGNPYELMSLLKDHTKFRKVSPGEILTLVR